jgi:NAD(P)-dependent dehydrogenase (short-subunit alcohol dehydrogenase family)
VDLAEEDIDRVLGTNLKGTILPVRACLPLLRARAVMTEVFDQLIAGDTA